MVSHIQFARQIERISYNYIIGIIVLIGIPLNAISIVIFLLNIYKKRFRSPTFIYFAWLSLADLLVLFGCGINFTLASILDVDISSGNEFLCQTKRTFRYFALQWSSFILCTSCLHQCLVITSAHQSKLLHNCRQSLENETNCAKRLFHKSSSCALNILRSFNHGRFKGSFYTHVICITLAIISLISVIPLHFVYQFSSNPQLCQFTNDGWRKYFFNVHSLLHTILYSLGPSSFMVVTSIIITVYLSSLNKVTQDNNSNSINNIQCEKKSKFIRKISIILLVMSFNFLLFALPVDIYLFAFSINQSKANDIIILSILRPFFIILHSIRFFYYLLASTQFRETVLLSKNISPIAEQSHISHHIQST
ncbi:hypothetical protein SNEBB_009576 [Seison nebaliae]|nr:hypothetical protein SNEBB_009576 [Seison nebaliae]